MGKLLLITTLILSIIFLSSQTNVTETGVCKEVEAKARAIMRARQRGLSLKQMILSFIKHEGVTIPSDSTMLLIEKAYGVRVFRPSVYKNKATKEFVEKVFLQCHEP